MKKIFFFASALLFACTLCAQTLTMDGDKSDWAEIPMLTEPGVYPMLKMVVPQDGLTLPEGAALSLMVEGEHEQIKSGYPVVYVDANKQLGPGSSRWFCPMMDKDYELATWSTGSKYGANEDGTVREMTIMAAAFNNVDAPFVGNFWAWLTFNWGELYMPYVPGEGETRKWSESKYHPLDVAPYAYADLSGEHTATGAFATHEALMPGDTLQLSHSGHDTAFWVSWAVELKQQAIYNVSIDVDATNTSSIDLYLVDVATNNIVATAVGANLSAPQEPTEYGTWDLSAVPAGKYMLKVKNHVKYSDTKFISVTLTAPAVEEEEEEVSYETFEFSNLEISDNGDFWVLTASDASMGLELMLGVVLEDASIMDGSQIYFGGEELPILSSEPLKMGYNEDGVETYTARVVVEFMGDKMGLELVMYAGATSNEPVSIVATGATATVDEYDWLVINGTWNGLPLVVKVAGYEDAPYKEYTGSQIGEMEFGVWGETENDFGFANSVTVIKTGDNLDVMAEFISYLTNITYNVSVSATLQSNPGTGLDNIDTTVAPAKVIENGQLIIIRGGVKFNATGAIVK